MPQIIARNAGLSLTTAALANAEATFAAGKGVTAEGKVSHLDVPGVITKVGVVLSANPTATFNDAKDQIEGYEEGYLRLYAGDRLVAAGPFQGFPAGGLNMSNNGTGDFHYVANGFGFEPLTPPVPIYPGDVLRGAIDCPAVAGTLTIYIYVVVMVPETVPAG